MYRFSRKERAFLELQRVGRMAMVGRNGAPRVTPLCHVFSKGVLYIEADEESWKVRNLTRRNQAAYVVDEYTENWGNLRGIRLQGPVEMLLGGPEYASAKRRLFRKYPQFKELWKTGSHVVMKLTPIKATAWGI